MIKCKYQPEYKNINKFIKKAKNILFVPHVDPDPDALCSSYALWQYINQSGKNGYIGLQAPLFAKYDFIFGEDKEIIVQPQNIESIKNKIDLIIAVDVGVSSRGAPWTTNLNGVPIMNIDHHIDNDRFGDINIVDKTYSSTCEMIYEFFKINKIDIIEKMGKAIYTGIVYDTGSFRYNATSQKTHSFVGEIVNRFDFDKNEVYEILFENKKVQSLALQMKVFNSLELFNNGTIALTTLDRNGYKECNAEESDAMELVRVGSSIEGVDFSIFIHEKKDKIKVSLRSKGDFNVNAVAKRYDGGGHVKASGFSMQGTVEEVKNKILSELIQTYEDYLHGKQ